MEGKSAYSEGHHGLQEAHYLRAKKGQDIKNYITALPKIKKPDYMDRASLGLTFGTPSSRKRLNDLDKKLLKIDLNNYSSSSKTAAPMYNKPSISYGGLENSTISTSATIYGGSSSTYLGNKTTYMT